VSKLLAYLQLIRLPNVFTALADVAMGFAVTHDLQPLASPKALEWVSFISLLVASACLYMAGMALNDAFDVEIDRAERADRPIPSGRVSLPAARRLGFGLLGIGVVIAIALSVAYRDPRSAVVGLGLAVSIVAYDVALKHTALGPLGMGLCRFLNVLLGMSLSPAPWEKWHYLVAAGIGVYIVGVTWFARTEARTSNRLPLLLATLVGAAGVIMLVMFPRFAPAEQLSTAVQNDLQRWYALWALLGLLIAWRCVWAIADPNPLLVQRAIRQCIFSLILLDAVVTFAVAGFAAAVAVMLLLLPTMFLGQFIYST
jgi:4-hydroxybenzoate polyprenyltransferase